MLTGFPCSGINIPNVRRLADTQQHITEDAVIPEHVLRFQIGAGAPAMHHGNEFVLPFMELRRQVKLCSVVRAFRITHIFAVAVKIQAVGYPHKGNHRVLFRMVNMDKAAVDTHKVILFAGVLPAGHYTLIAAHPGKDRADLLLRGDYRRMIGKLISGVDIERLVISPELPAGWDIQCIKATVICVQRVGQICRSGIEPEVPHAVEALHFGRCIAFFLRLHRVRFRPGRVWDKIAAGRQSVLLEHREVAVVLLVDPVFHDSSPFSPAEGRSTNLSSFSMHRSAL